ncbi:MAG: YwaF family protein [Clostridia bacterium]|nr:YwaF family protein [Clostridia bacterium]
MDDSPHLVQLKKLFWVALMVYVISAGTIALLIALYFLFRRFIEAHARLFLKIFAVLILALFAVRYYASSGSLLEGVHALSDNPFYGENAGWFSSKAFSNVFMVLVTVDVWMEIASVLVVFVFPFFKKGNVFENVARSFTLIFSVINIALLRWTSYSYTGSYGLDVCSVFMSVESAFVFCVCLYSACKSGLKLKKNEFLGVMYVVPAMIVFTMMPWTLEELFGNFGYAHVTRFNAFHRGYIYAGIVFVIVMYFYLRNKDREYIRMMLLYISLAAVVTYCSKYDYTSLYTVSEWPLHLCNTIMFIVPLCLMFKFDWLFYFALFFGVLGAFVAMLIPTYERSMGVFSPEVISYWQNHILAFGIPLTMLFTGVYQRPKLKHFFYSLVGFAVYFLLVIILNSYLNTDFFYTNKDQITSLLGSFGIRLKEFTLTFELPNSTLTYYPLYQILFFVIYVLVAFLVWFVYAYIFKIQDHYRHVEGRRREIKAEEYAACVASGVASLGAYQNEETKGKIVLDGVYKRYGENEFYSAADVSFEVHDGEVIAFLGHNGAGKSTIIKSIVGIHPLTKGKIEVNGYDVSTQPVEAKAEIGFVPDHYALFERLTGREYINHMADLYGVSEDERNKRISELCGKFRMEDSIDSKIQTYSHGMKQKVAIMAALIHDPKVLILDEPLTGLDPASVYEVKECLREHAQKGNIVFFSTHLIDVVEKLCTRVIIIKGGVIQASREMAELAKEGVDLEKYFLEVGEGADGDIKRVPVEKEEKGEEELDFLFRKKVKINR